MAAKIPSTKSKPGSKPNNKKFDNNPKKRKFDKTDKHTSKHVNHSTPSDTSTPANKKRALKQQRQSHRKHATTVRTAKEIWNELRLKSNTPETTSKLATELYDLLKGKMMEVAMQHDASRMVQAVVQFGGMEERRGVVRELCGEKGASAAAGAGNEEKGANNINLGELCKIQYAHFVVLKMIKYCARDDECVKLIVKNLKKQMTKLAVHSVGSRVVELLFATFPSKATAPLKLELYGPQYALFATSIEPTTDKTSKSNNSSLPTLPTFISQNPTKLAPTLTHLQSLLQKGLDKSLTGFSYFHSLLHDYISIAPPNDIQSFLSPALVDHTLHLLSTRHGTKVVAECFAYATVKDRKKMLKCLKGYARSSLLHRDAYLGVLRMVDVMDDTVLVNKMLLAELHTNPNPEKKGDDEMEVDGEDKSPILDLVLSDTGSRLFLMLLVPREETSEAEEDATEKDGSEKDKSSTPRWQKYFDPYERSVLHANPSILEDGKPVPTSKKEDETRRQELVVYVKDLLLEVCTKHTEEMMRSQAGSRVLVEYCESYPSDEVFERVVEVCASGLKGDKEVGDEGDEDDDNDEGDVKKSLPILEDPVGHLAIKHLLLNESKHLSSEDDEDEDENDSSLARMFYTKLSPHFETIASSNRGAFVLSALIKVPGVKDDVKKELKGCEKMISKLAKGGKDGKNGKGEKKLAGCSVLLDALKSK